VSIVGEDLRRPPALQGRCPQPRFWRNMRVARPRVPLRPGIFDALSPGRQAVSVNRPGPPDTARARAARPLPRQRGVVPICWDGAGAHVNRAAARCFGPATGVDPFCNRNVAVMPL
jgi:hypothetical protein